MSKKTNPKPSTPTRLGGGYNWIYLVIFIGLIGLQFAANQSSATSPSSFNDFSKMALRGDVDHVKVVNKEIVLVFIKEEALKKNEAYEKISKKAYGDGLNPGPHFEFEMPAETFEIKIQRLYEIHADWYKSNGELAIEYKEENN